MSKELWKDIPGYEGLYQVSSLGRVKSLERTIKTGKNCNHEFSHLKERILGNIARHSPERYVSVVLSKDGKTSRFGVHKLVAQAFIPNPNDYPIVNHKDEDRSNNCVDNLEWCTYSYNNTYNGRIEKCKDKISSTLKGRPWSRELTEVQREHIRQGAIRGWETRRKHDMQKSAITNMEEVESE